MLIFYELIKDTWLFPILVIVIIMVVIIIISKFLQSLISLIDDIQVLSIKLFRFFKSLIKLLLSIILFPFTIWSIIDRYKFNKSLIVNNSIYKEYSEDE